MLSNDDGENCTQSKLNVQSTLIINNSSPSPARPGFPKRVVIHDKRVVNESFKPLAFDQKKNLTSFPTSATIIPTTLIKCNAYNVAPTHGHAVYKDQETTAVPVNKKQEPHYKLDSPERMNNFQVTSPTEQKIPTSTFDYLYEFSETRKVLEEFFKCPDDKVKELEKFSDFNESDDSCVSLNFYKINRFIKVIFKHCRIYSMTIEVKSKKRWRICAINIKHP